MSSAALVSPHLLSAEAGRKILLDGGNAVDAAIAVVAAQGVVAPETCGIGGDLFALVHRPGEEKPLALNASGRSGSGGHASALRDAGFDHVPRDHPLAVTIPGCVDGLVALSDRLGHLDLAACLEPAVALAEQGFPASREQARTFTSLATTYRDNPAVASFYPDGGPVAVGDVVKRPELGRTLREIAEGGREAFYQGRAGAEICSVLSPYVTEEDLLAEQVEWTEPIGLMIGDDTAWTIPPNSAGYLGPATLAVFLLLDPPDDPADPQWWHLMIEAHRSLAWERDLLVSDPGTAPEAPAALYSQQRLERAANAVSLDRAGIFRARRRGLSGTAYMCVSDDAGVGVSIIQSNFHGTGSPFGAARSGFLLQDRGRGFTVQRGHPNELLPGKRPAHTLAPTLWTRGHHASWLLGTRGGDVQPQLVAQLAARAILGHQDLENAQASPRWTIESHGQAETSHLVIEPGSGVVADLRALGHTVTERETMQSGWGPMGIIDLRSDDARAAADPRVDTARAIEM